MHTFTNSTREGDSHGRQSSRAFLVSSFTSVESPADFAATQRCPIIPGASVVLIENQAGPVMTVTNIRISGLTRFCTLAWFDAGAKRCEVELPAADLMLVEY